MRIATKLVLLLVTLVVSVMGVQALITVSQTRERLDDELRKMAEHIGVALSVGTLHHLEGAEAAGVREVVDAISRHDDVVGAVVFDAAGRRVAFSSSLPDSVSRAAAPEVSSKQPLARAEPGHAATYVSPVLDAQGRMQGSLRLVLRERSVLPYVIPARNRILWTILTLTVVLAASVYWATKRQIAEPLRALSLNAEALGRGDLDRRIPENGEDEVAELAAAFNRMAENLQATNRAIVEEREYIRRIVDSSPEGIVVADEAGRITLWNRTMAERFEKPLEAVLGKPLDDALPHAETESLGCVCERIRSREQARILLDAVRFPDAGERVFTVIGSPLRESAGAAYGTVLVLVDVTERTRLERQVQQSERLAAVGQLAAGVAHEIGTPLNVISGSAEYLLADIPEGDARREELETIVSEVSRISGLVRQLMDFARQEDHRVEAVDLQGVVASVVRLVTRQLEKARVEVDVDFDAGVPNVHGDRDQIQQVVLNLVMNAWQAMPEGGRLAVSARPCTYPDDEGAVQPGVLLRVADTGSGIEAKRVDRIFDPFYTTKDIGEGTGLGLAIAHRIVERHGGRIEVRTEVGRGTTFEVTLPEVPGEAARG